MKIRVTYVGTYLHTYIRTLTTHRIDVKEKEDPADCLDNDLQQIFGSVISPDLEIMKQEEENLKDTDYYIV